MALSALLLLMLAGCVNDETGGAKSGTTQQRLQAFLDLARGYLEKRDYANARPPLEQALKVDPTSAEAHVLMASVYLADGDKQLAEREYKDALRYEPRNAMAQNNYGTFPVRRGQVQGSGGTFEGCGRRSEVRTARAGVRKSRSDAAQTRSTPADAEQSFLRALMLNTAQPRSAFELADIYFTAGDFARSKQYFDILQRDGATDLAQPVARHSPESRRWTTRISSRATRWR